MVRRGQDGITAEEVEVEYAKIDGVKFEFFKAPVEITDDGVKFIKTEVIEEEGSRGKLVMIEGTEEIFEADSVIIAAGQGPRANIVSTTNGINVTKEGLVATDELGHTTREGVFASGDVVTGAKTVVGAVKLSKIVAEAMDEYVCSKYNL
jgi:glutamate synthase (NADPH/NADH) small chain